MRALGLVGVATLALSLTACASDDLRDDRTAVIAGHETADMTSDAEAQRTVLREAAQITADHGYQYFVVVSRDVWTPSGNVHTGTGSAIRPGEDVTIKVYHDGEVPAGTRDAFNAQRILNGGAQQTSVPLFAPQPYTSTAPGASTPQATPRCTAYGCDW